MQAHRVGEQLEFLASTSDDAQLIEYAKGCLRNMNAVKVYGERPVHDWPDLVMDGADQPHSQKPRFGEPPLPNHQLTGEIAHSSEQGGQGGIPDSLAALPGETAPREGLDC